MKKITITAALILTFLLSSCGSQEIYKTGISGYTKVYDAIPGFGYEIVSELLKKSTVITSLSGGDYSEGTYCYKNGTDAYIIFDINQFVIAVGRNTSFGFSGEDTVSDKLQNTSLNGIWFTPEKNMEYAQEKKRGATKTMIRVVAEVSITEDLFGTFVGQLTTITTNDSECSMFMGVRGNSCEEISKNNQKLISNICASFVTVSNDEKFEVAEVNTEEKVAMDALEHASNNKKNDTETEKSESQSEKNDVVDIILEPSEMDNEPYPVEAEETESEDKEDTSVVIIDETSELIEEDEETEEKKTETGDENKPEKQVQTNHKPTVADSVGNSITVIKGGASSPYRQLNIGSVGTLTGIASKRQASQMSIRLDAVYRDQEAADLLLQLKEKDDKIKDLLAPPGTSFEIAEYALSKNPNTDYVNIRMTGLDGNNLVHRGVSYNKRTYDCFLGLKFKDGMYGKLYCIYAVPNGCMEYSLVCGDVASGELAYFKIAREM